MEDFVIVKVGKRIIRRAVSRQQTRSCIVIGAYMKGRAVAHPNYVNDILPIFEKAGIKKWDTTPVSYCFRRPDGSVRCTADYGCNANEKVVDMVEEKSSKTRVRA